ncbi:MAG: lipopolysaccharide biosynthesis protein [Thermodesulfobacteriota bacterium]
MKPNNKYTEFFNTGTLADDLKKKSIHSGAFAFAAEGINFVLRVGSISVLARILIPEHFGLLSMVMAITVIAAQFKDMGLSLATVQQKEITHEQVSTLFWINLIVGLVITLILCVCSRVVGWFYADHRLVWITMAIATTFFWSGLTVQHQALLRRRMEYLKISVINVGANLCGVFIAIVLAVKGYGYWALVLREVTVSIFVAIGMWVACPWVPGLPKRNTGIGRMVRFGGDVTGFNIVTYFTDSLDQILLGKFYGANLLGIYRQAYQLIMVPIAQINNPVQLVGQSSLSLLQDQAVKFRRYYSRILTLLSFVTMPLAAFLFVHAKDVILLVLGPKWIGAVVIFRIFAFAVFIRPVLSTTGLVMIACGKSKRYLFLGVANSIMITMSIVIGLRWGAVGVAAGHVIENYIVVLPIVYFALRGTPISLEVFFQSILPSVISSLLMGGVLSIFHSTMKIGNSLAAIGASFSIGIVIYLVAWAMMPRGILILKELFADFVFMFKKAESRQVVKLS